MMTVDEWVAGYQRCWEEADAVGVRALFSDDATYRSDMFAEPHHGRDGIEAYWSDVTSTQSNVSVQMGRPVVGENRTVVEWWTLMDNSGEPVTLPGCLLLRFDDEGLCTELEEYFLFKPGRSDPPGNWGR